MTKMTAKSEWKVGQQVVGEYFGNKISGKINSETRPTPDYKNVQFWIDLDSPIVVYGTERNRVCVLTNDKTEWIAAA